ncbi:thioredoxin TrxA [Spirosoma sp. HMF4905]|uniref:Thioredoxin n=1 Tax=Spirosoma arboris TaxID=2682092 RepID=A0A7K1SDL5_9BACT|nr:thioredoxin TrxA [Spirosoma arboris]MVM31879.1 thioredoxin TrxA [Spirosoma arboris]
MASELTHHVSDASFDNDVLRAEYPVLVYYWAEWSGPCKMMAPMFDEVAETYNGRLKIAKLNIDHNEDTPPRWGVKGIPTVMIFMNGRVEATKTGAFSKSQLMAFIDVNI